MGQPENEYVIWDFQIPGISFDLREGRIVLFKSTLKALQYPDYYRFLFDPGNLRIAVQACGSIDEGARRLPAVIMHEHHAVKNISLVRIVYEACNWNCGLTYRVPGTAVLGERMVTFDLKAALELHEWRLKKQRKSWGK